MPPQTESEAIPSEHQPQVSSINSQQSQADPESAWEEADCIVGERGNPKNKEYLVSWKGRDINGKPHEPMWLEPKNITADLIDTWNIQKQQKAAIRTAVNRQRKQQQEEKRARERERADEARQRRETERASRLQHREALRRSTARSSRGQRVEAIRDSSPVTVSSLSSSFSPQVTPPHPIRNRRVIDSPDDADTPAKSVEAPPAAAIDETSAPQASDRLIIEIPHDIPLEDYEAYYSSSLAAALGTATDLQGSSSVTQHSTQIESQVPLSSSAPVPPRIIPDSQSFSTTDISKNGSYPASHHETQRPEDLSVASESVDAIVSQTDQTSGSEKVAAPKNSAETSLRPSCQHLTEADKFSSFEVISTTSLENSAEANTSTLPHTSRNQKGFVSPSKSVDQIIGSCSNGSAAAKGGSDPAEEVQINSEVVSNHISHDSTQQEDTDTSRFESQIPHKSSPTTSTAVEIKSSAKATIPQEVQKLDDQASHNFPSHSNRLQTTNLSRTVAPDVPISAQSLTESNNSLDSPLHQIIEASAQQNPPLTLSTGSAPQIQRRALHKMVEAIAPSQAATPSSPPSVAAVAIDGSTPMSQEGLDYDARKALAKANRKRLRESRPRSTFKFELDSFADVGAEKSPAQAGLNLQTVAQPSIVAAVLPETRETSPLLQDQDVVRLSAQIPNLNSVTNHGVLGQDFLKQPNFFVPIEMTATQKSIYGRIFRFGGASMQRFIDDETNTPELMEKVTDIVESANCASLHTDLVETPSLTQGQPAPERQAEWAVVNSNKFKFLRILFSLLEDLDCHVVIFTKPGRAIDTLETFIHGSNISYTRPDQHRGNRSGRGACRVSLIATSGQQIVERADLVIGLDETFDLNDPQVLQVRKDMIEVNRSCPAICLVTPYTTEHFQRTTPAGKSRAEFLRASIFSAARAREIACSPLLPEKFLACEELAAAIASFMRDGNSADWVLPSIYDIQIPSNYYIHSPASEDASSSAAEDIPNKRKRSSHDIGFKDLAGKKPRLESPTIYDEPSQSSASITRILDSGIVPAIVMPLEPALAASQEERLLTDPDPLQAALEREAALKSQLVAAQAQVTALQKQNTSIESITAILQSTFDEQFQELQSARKEAATLKAALETAETRRAAATTTIATLRADNATLKANFDAASKERLQSTDPVVRDSEEFRVQTQRIEDLEKKLAAQTASRNHDFQYMRDQYEEASNKAIEHAQAASALEAENAKLKEQASGEMTKLRAMYESNNMSLAHGELEKVTHERDNLKRLLQHMETERERLQQQLQNQGEMLEKRAGMALSTRASSLPPRAASAAAAALKGQTGAAEGRPVGGTAMARVASALGRINVSAAGSRPSSRAGSRVGSRQGTPVPGRG